MVLQVKNLMKTYKKNLAALHNVSCSLEKGAVGLIGPNGAGKTTLLKILAGLEKTTGGIVSFNGIELLQNKEFFRSIIGYLPQEFDFHKSLTAEAILDYIAVLKGVHDRKVRRYMVDEAIEWVNLKHARNSVIREYSYGMKRRLGIAQALLGKPSLVLLDEPLEGLDPGESMRVEGLISEVAKLSLVIISTHSLHNVEFGCNKLLVLREGRLLYEGAPAALAGLAKGLVWEMEADSHQIQQFKAICKVVGVQQKGGQVLIRVLSSRKPDERAIPVRARLEDGYLTLMHAGGQS